MKLLINGKRQTIKPANQLTVAEYMKMTEKSTIDIVSYIAALTDVPYTDVLQTQANIHQLTILSGYIDKIKSFDYYYSITNIRPLLIVGYKQYTTSKLKWDAIGVRLMLEQKMGKVSTVELAVYALAVMLQGDFDNDKTEAMYQRLLCENANEVLPVAGFFLRKYIAGSANVIHLLRALCQRVWTKAQRYTGH